jgi:hypothetical protein
MRTRLGFMVLPLAGLLAVGCGGDGEDTGNGGSDFSLGGSSTPQTFDKVIKLPSQNIPLSHTFKETLTRFGVTVTPQITPSGKFTLDDADVHVQAQYTTAPPAIKRLDILTRGTWGASARVDLDVTSGADWKTSTPDFKKDFSLGTSIGNKAFEIIKIPLTSITLPGSTNIQLQLAMEVAASCELSFDDELHAFAEIGIGGSASGDVFYDSSKPAGQRVGFVANGGLTSADQFHVTVPPHVAFKDGNLGQVHGKCGLQPSINATAVLGSDPNKPLADVGVKFVVEPYAQFDGTFKSIDDWQVEAKTGINATVAPFGDFFGMPFSTTADLQLFDLDIKDASSNPTTPTVLLGGPGLAPK